MLSVRLNQLFDQLIRGMIPVRTYADVYGKKRTCLRQPMQSYRTAVLLGESGPRSGGEARRAVASGWERRRATRRALRYKLRRPTRAALRGLLLLHYLCSSDLLHSNLSTVELDRGVTVYTSPFPPTPGELVREPRHFRAR